MPTAIALIPARGGSQRIKDKNIRSLGGHPLIAYTIATARASRLFERVVVSTESQRIAEIARYYGAEVPFPRPREYATATSPDIEWLAYTLEKLNDTHDIFALLRPTSPFRNVDTLHRAWKRFSSLDRADSLRAVELCRQHPGKMWVVDGDYMCPLLDQSHLRVPWHASQYQALPRVYAQNSSLEMGRVRTVRETGTKDGTVITPFFTDPIEGFSLDYEDDWERAERLIASGRAAPPTVDRPPFREC